MQSTSTSRPHLKAPPGTCDTHMHIYDPEYPKAPTAAFDAPNAPLSAYIKVRERLGIAPFDPTVAREEMISVDATAQRLGICVGSVHRLIRQGVLPAQQIMPSAPWQVPVAALATETVQIGVRDVIARRPKNFKALQDVSTLRLPGI